MLRRDRSGPARPLAQGRNHGKGGDHALRGLLGGHGRHQHLHPPGQDAGRPRALEPRAGGRRPAARGFGALQRPRAQRIRGRPRTLGPAHPARRAGQRALPGQVGHFHPRRTAQADHGGKGHRERGRRLQPRGRDRAAHGRGPLRRRNGPRRARRRFLRLPGQGHGHCHGRRGHALQVLHGGQHRQWRADMDVPLLRGLGLCHGLQAGGRADES